MNFTLVLALMLSQVALWAETKREAPDFKEVYDLIRAHLGGMSEDELNRKAAGGLVRALSPRVSLASNANGASGSSDGPALAQTNIFDGDIIYLRARRVDDSLAKSVASACERLRSPNKLRGVVLDLRYAGGDDYAAVAAAADLFLNKPRSLLDWGNGTVKAKEKTDAISVPVAVLVNRETTGAAEALAAVLRQAAAALILGNKTAGQAMIMQEYPLKNGDRLRIATTPVKLGDGTELSSNGLAPDIAVDVSSEDERAYYADAFRVLPRGNLLASQTLSLTNSSSGITRTNRRPRINEAELVRERKEGLTPETDLSLGREPEAEGPMVHDPTLARALDVLKGLAIVRRARS
jgi:hypothetical protein